ncbi:uncharacterized protein At4g22758-like [Macadamia integrifolia]|uniref:uncharacterized protein At4g22758-like n=1 Tax=Macadamia integrifolia TaxID=60698 RepID=UPI001C4E73E1|nr:uncharacterized protein At4g22758-like [Macadamia integrifolia]XP_042512704.1 uncharacterized protein At4g22758-like [Macadamia integrifolia]XP_042512705.1 uncharacterized protein At4g22758-like [Macadamia integrifolia]
MHRPESYPGIPRRIRGILEPSVSGGSTSSENGYQKLTKVLVNVTVERSLGPVHVLLSPEKTVEDLIKAALDVYLKEKRRTSLTESDPHCYELHYSQFALESLNPKEKLINLGSRNFFLCSKRTNPVNSSSSEQTKKASANK